MRLCQPGTPPRRDCLTINLSYDPGAARVPRESYDRAKLKEELEDVHKLFKDAVSKYRQDLDLEKIATGEHWYGTRALELGLADELKTSDELLADGILKQLVYVLQFLFEFCPITAGKYKRNVTIFGKNTDEDRAKLKEELEDVRKLFNAAESFRFTSAAGAFRSGGASVPHRPFRAVHRHSRAAFSVRTA